jgi:hypothetical protein
MATKRSIEMAKTYNSMDTLIATLLTTNPPVSYLNRAERTGSLVVSAAIDPISLKTNCLKKDKDG